MGWYDISRMGFVNLQSKKGIKFISLLALIVFGFFAVTSIYAQSTPDKDSKKNKKVNNRYLKIKYPVNIKLVYQMDDTTKVKRTFRDNSTREYTRILTYFFSQRLTNDAKNDFMEMEFSMDSLVYKFIEDDKTMEISSTDPAYEKTFSEDLSFSAIPLNKVFNVTYSPYGDVAKLESEKLDWFKKYLDEQAQKFNDTLKVFFWNEALNSERYIHLGNVKKLVLPKEKVADDSVWLSPFEIQIDHKTFSGVGKTKITDAQLNSTTVTATFDELKAKNSVGIYNSIKAIVGIENGKSKGSYSIRINNKYILEEAKANFETELNSFANKEKFKDNIQTSIRYRLLKMYKW